MKHKRGHRNARAVNWSTVRAAIFMVVIGGLILLFAVALISHQNDLIARCDAGQVSACMMLAR